MPVTLNTVVEYAEAHEYLLVDTNGIYTLITPWAAFQDYESVGDALEAIKTGELLTYQRNTYRPAITLLETPQSPEDIYVPF